jgi:fluoride exporter
MSTLLAVGVGAFFGAITRYGIGIWIGPADGFPWGTFVINVTGSFLLGILMFVMRGDGSPDNLRALATTGFCGGYTTFSTFSYELIVLMQSGRMSIAVGYAIASTIAAPLACWCGWLLGGFVRGW